MKIAQLYTNNHHAFQQKNYSCGPVTLLNILRQQGDYSHTEDELIKLCNASPGIGTTDDDLVSGAMRVGLSVIEEGSGASIRDIERHIDAGNFVVVNYFYAFSNNVHYAQVADYDDVSLYLIDPTAGYMRIKKEYFAQHWHSQSGASKNWLMSVR